MPLVPIPPDSYRLRNKFQQISTRIIRTIEFTKRLYNPPTMKWLVGVLVMMRFLCSASGPSAGGAYEAPLQVERLKRLQCARTTCRKRQIQRQRGVSVRQALVLCTPNIGTYSTNTCTAFDHFCRFEVRQLVQLVWTHSAFERANLSQIKLKVIEWSTIT